MSDPSPYVVTYNFTGFQNNSPTSPLPAPQVDNELLNIATSIASLVDAVMDVRRDDGALNNEIVTYDSLDLALKLMLDPTNATLVAGAVAAAQAAAAAAGGSASAAAISAAAALVSEINAAASAATVNLSLYLAKANNLAGLGSQSTSRSNLGLGSVATFDVGTGANNILQLNGSSKIPAVDGSLLTGIDTLPVGAIILQIGTVVLPGTLKLNGALLSRATYPRLFTYAQGSGAMTTEAGWVAFYAAYSSGDLSTTFRLPDVRGEFIRMLAEGAGLDAGRAIGTPQLDTFKDHTHTGNLGGATITVVSAAGAAVLQPGGTTTSTASVGAGTETRPHNIPMTALVKY